MAQGSVVGSLIVDVIVVIVVLWIAMYWFAEPDRKPVVACAPLYYTIGVGERVVKAGGVDVAGAKKMTWPQVTTLACIKAVDRFVRTK
jgi:preprotein translocase subunit YajC